MHLQVESLNCVFIRISVLVAKDSHNPMILKLVLGGLTREWDVSVCSMSMPYNHAVNPAMHQASATWNAQPKRPGGPTVSSRTSITNVPNTGMGLELMNLRKRKLCCFYCCGF